VPLFNAGEHLGAGASDAGHQQPLPVDLQPKLPARFVRPDFPHGGEDVIALRFRNGEPVGQAFGIAIPEFSASGFGGHARRTVTPVLRKLRTDVDSVESGWPPSSDLINRGEAGNLDPTAAASKASLQGAICMSRPTRKAIICTTLAGIIEHVDDAGAQLLNISRKNCRGRNLITAFSHDRLVTIKAMRDAAHGEVVRAPAVIRPRERKPLAVTFTVGLDPQNLNSLQWLFELDV
jgi:hypothetical protein